MKILIVDDDELTLNSMSHVLKAENYEVLKAESAAKALHILETDKIDMVISDIMMPNISGLGFLTKLKEFYSDKIPVIFISSLDQGVIVGNAMEMGASGFFTKPIDYQELLLKIGAVIKTDYTASR